MFRRVLNTPLHIATMWKMSVFGVFLVRIFPHSKWICRDAEYLSVFSPDAWQYAPGKTPNMDVFCAVHFIVRFLKFFFRIICDALRNLEPFVQFKKREKHPWSSVAFNKVAGRLKPTTLLKVTLLHECFSRLLNCANSTKWRKASHRKPLRSFVARLCKTGKISEVALPLLFFILKIVIITKPETFELKMVDSFTKPSLRQELSKSVVVTWKFLWHLVYKHYKIHTFVDYWH